MLFPQHLTTRSQDLPEVFHDAAQFYWGTVDAWLKGTPIFGGSSAIVELPRWRVQDLDTEDDWLRAEAMMSYLREAMFAERKRGAGARHDDRAAQPS